MLGLSNWRRCIVNIFEYLTKDSKNKPYFDEDGNVYVDFSPAINGLGYFMDEGYPFDKRCYFATKEIYEKYAKIAITVTEDIDESFWDIRRPYFRLRGKPVTQEQAFDIIRRTDSLFRFMEIVHESDTFLSSFNFSNSILEKRDFTNRYGWVHPDGFIGINDTPTEKYPELYEFVIEWVRYLAEFYYLDIMIAFTCWEEVPPAVLKSPKYDLLETWEYNNAYDEKFLKAIVFGIHVHDDKVEILNRKDARIKYQEYNHLYGTQRERFVVDYCADNGIFEADLEYAKRCIASYGLDADEELHKLPKYLQKWFGMEEE